MALGLLRGPVRLAPPMTSENPVAMLPGVRASKFTFDSMKNGGFKGKRRFAPVPSR